MYGHAKNQLKTVLKYLFKNGLYRVMDGKYLPVTIVLLNCSRFIWGDFYRLNKGTGISLTKPKY
jgi:hypothetical protein